MTPYLQQRSLYPPQIMMKPSLNLGIIVVIPAYKEEFLLLSLMSLKKCQLPNCDVEVIVVINDSDRDSDATRAMNQGIFLQAVDWAKKNYQSKLRFHILYHDYLGAKHAGVGLARKIGMDEAVYRFEKIKKPRGIIVCFDADSRCAKNYLRAIETHFQTFKKSPACAIHFEHPLEGYEYEETIYQAVAKYELHLRYYTLIQKFTGFPFATDTIGSSMAVKSNAYQKQGGMNKRKAGEDFYFLHKFSCHPNFTQLTETTVYPSPRKSDRVPFGTGKAIQEIIQSKEEYTSYAPQTFVDLKVFFSHVNSLFLFDESQLNQLQAQLPKSIRQYLKLIDWQDAIREIQQNTSRAPQFRNRFFRWFNAFQIMKYAHFCRDHFYPSVPVEEAAKWLLKNQYQIESKTGVGEMLIELRTIQKEECLI